MAGFSLQNKNIIVTGASSGIGAYCCKTCSESGANMVMLGRNTDKLERVFKSLGPGNHSVVTVDLLNVGEIGKMLEGILEFYGNIDGFIHSAGFDNTKPLASLKEAEYASLFTLNVVSGFEVARIISKNKYVKSGASYIFISSVMGIVGDLGKIAYSATKGALIAGCRSMALELAIKKIRVNCISPGIVQTEMVTNLFANLPEESVANIKSRHPLGIGNPEDIANACVFLLSDEARWITGSNLIIDGGYSCH